MTRTQRLRTSLSAARVAARQGAGNRRLRQEENNLVIKVSKGTLGAEELERVEQAMAYGYFGMSSLVAEFEQALRAYLGAEHVLAVNSGTSALHLALASLGLGPGDEVILPSLTFVGAFQAISATGATPIPCDVHSHTLLIDLADVERRITSRTRVIMPVHYAGNPCDLDGLHDLGRRKGIRVVEDAAHAFGSLYKGKKIGGFGDVACFSFDSIKNITCGEGGAIVCREDVLAKTIRTKRAVGIDRDVPGLAAKRGWAYEVHTQGYRYHMSTINAAIGLAQLRKLDTFAARRRQICERYDAAFSDLSGLTTLPIDYRTVTPHIYVVRVEGGRRDDLLAYLRDREIEGGINYIPNHLQPFYRTDGVALPNTERAFREILTLPLHCGLSDDDVARVIDAVTAFVRGAATVPRADA